LLFALFCVKV